MIRLTSFPWVWFQCVFPLMPSCNTYHLIGFLLPWVWGISSLCCSSKVQLLLLTLDEGYLLTAALPDLQRGIASLGPPEPAQPLHLGCGVAPPGHRLWPRAWGCGVAPPGHHPWPRLQGISSRPPPLTLDLGSSSRPFLRRHSLELSATAPDLGRGVAPLSRA